ncbi:glycosyltransferase, partial [Pseudonocardia zijingensis]
MNILIWHVHGAYTEAFVQGAHRYLLPTLPEGGPWGGGRAGRDWPANAVERTPDQLADDDVDVVVLQRPDELELARSWLGRTPGRDVPAVYLEHNTPGGPAATTRHPVADRDDLLLVHVTAFNDLMWDSGTTATTVVEHGVPDPGHRWTGELPAAVAVINEPLRRGRVTGTDLLPLLAGPAGIDVFGMGTSGLGTALGTPSVRGMGDQPQQRMHAELARRRVYVHTARWTSLGLSLIEAMMLGMPVAVLATTEAARAVPPDAGVLATDPDLLRRGIAELAA